MKGLLQSIGTTSDTRKERLIWRILKKVLPRIYLKFSAKRVLCAVGHIFNKVKRGIVQKPDTVGPQNWPDR